MRVKWNNQTLNLNNELSKPTKDFYCNWNNYSIQITFDEWIKRHYKRNEYSAWCYDPKGGACVAGGGYSSIQEALQECFDNIWLPLVNINDPDEEDKDETNNWKNKSFDELINEIGKINEVMQ